MAQLNTPYFLVDEGLLKKNLEILRQVAQEAGCPCVLLAQGHQSRARLETAGVPVLESLSQVPAFLRGLQA